MAEAIFHFLRGRRYDKLEKKTSLNIHHMLGSYQDSKAKDGKRHYFWHPGVRDISIRIEVDNDGMIFYSIAFCQYDDEFVLKRANFLLQERLIQAKARNTKSRVPFWPKRVLGLTGRWGSFKVYDLDDKKKLPLIIRALIDSSPVLSSQIKTKVIAGIDEEDIPF